MLDHPLRCSARCRIFVGGAATFPALTPPQRLCRIPRDARAYAYTVHSGWTHSSPRQSHVRFVRKVPSSLRQNLVFPVLGNTAVNGIPA